MARLLAFEVALVSVVSVFASEAGCTSTSSNPGVADGAAMTPDTQSEVSLEDSSPNACTDASVKLIQASDYDQSCTVNTDCRLIAEGNACVPCAFNCPFSAAISVGALPKYMSDIANTPAVAAEFNGQNCLSACGNTSGPCCVGGKCQTSTTGQCPAAADAGDAAADTGVDVATDAAADASASDAADAARE